MIRDSTASEPYDVVVIGGGPAGAALATFLRQDGHRCLVVEREEFPRYHIGESLIPSTYSALDRMGLLPRLKASAFPPKYSVRFVAPSGEESDPFYFSETIEGDRARTWQVERSTFDRMCLDNAREQGVEVQSTTTVTEVLFDKERAVGVRARRADGRIVDIAARVVADASGHATVIGHQLGLRRPIPGLAKGSCWSYYKGGRRAPGIDGGETTVFMLPGRRWFWYIPLPDDIVSVGIVAPPEYLFGGTADLDAVFLREVENCRPLSERVARATRQAPVRRIPHLAYVNRQTCGDGWVMVGDARLFLDPIYSSGLFLAFASAELAAGCIHRALEAGDVSAARLGAFEPTMATASEVFWRLVRAFYDETFSFRAFVERFPEQRTALVDCLVGDVVGKDMAPFLSALALMTDPPPPLADANAAHRSSL